MSRRNWPNDPMPLHVCQLCSETFEYYSGLDPFRCPACVADPKKTWTGPTGPPKMFSVSAPYTYAPGQTLKTEVRFDAATPASLPPAAEETADTHRLAETFAVRETEPGWAALHEPYKP